MTDEEENDAVSNDKPRNSLPSDSIRVAPDVPGVSPLKHSHQSLLHDTGIGDQWVEYNRNLGSNCDFRTSTTSKRPFLEPLNDISTSPSRHTYGEASPSSASVRTPRKDNMGIYLTRVATGLRSTVKHAFRWRKRPPGPRDVRPSVRAFYYKLLNASRPALACFLATGVSMVYPWSHKVTWFSITLSISGKGMLCIKREPTLDPKRRLDGRKDELICCDQCATCLKRFLDALIMLLPNTNALKMIYRRLVTI